MIKKMTFEDKRKQNYGLNEIYDAWREVLARQGGIYAMLAIVKEGSLYLLPFIKESSANEKLFEAREEIMHKNPEFQRFDLQPARLAAEYDNLRKELTKRLNNGGIEKLIVLYEPGLTRSLKVRELNR